MRALILSLATALPLALSAAPLAFSAVPASASPLVVAVESGPAPALTLVAGGCGLGFHRGPYGGCRPNGFGFGGYRGGYVIPGRRYCPPGYHLGPYGRVCHPN